MAQKKQTKKGRLEDLVLRAYEIGHDHGSNPMRMALGKKPRSVDEGWGPIAIKIQNMFKQHTF
jgi:hypothetical protein